MVKLQNVYLYTLKKCLEVDLVNNPNDKWSPLVILSGLAPAKMRWPQCVNDMVGKCIAVCFS